MIIIKEYAIYPFKNINISQYYDEGNHLPHWKNSNNYSDKPWDEAGINSGREYFIPQNDFIVEEVLGLNNNITNSVRLKSVNKLYIPYKEESDYLYLTLTHMNEDNLKEVTVGQILKKGTMILLEGTDGLATGNHFHITANLGKYYGLLKNSNGAWCYTYEKSLTPEEAFYIDTNFNNVINSKSSVFSTLPLDSKLVGVNVERDRNKNQIYIKIDNLYCRKTPSINGEIIGYIRKGFYNYSEIIENDNYKWYNIGIGFVAYNSSWLDLYPKEVVEEIIEEDIEEKNEIIEEVDEKQKNGFFSTILNVFKKIIELFRKSKKL